MTDLQKAIMKLIMEGLTSKQIAHELLCTQKIVENNIVLMKAKFNAKNTVEMVCSFTIGILPIMLSNFGTIIAAKERKKVYKENTEIKKRKKPTVVQLEEANQYLESLGV